MEKLKVLFLTYYYPPQKCPRSIQISHLVQYLCNKFCLEIVTSHSEGMGDKSLLDFTPFDNINYARKTIITRFIEKSKGYRIKKSILPDFHYPWHFDLYKKTADITKRFERAIIVTFGQPMSTHIAGLKLKKKFPHLKWVAHFSDPWVDNIFNDYNTWVSFINKYYQDTVFCKADKLIFTSEETIDLVTLTYSPETKSKTLYLPHTFNANLYAAGETVTRMKNLLTIRYMGNFYGGRQPNCLFEALKNIQDSHLEHVRIELVGPATTTIEDLIKKCRLEKTVFTRPSVSYLNSLSLMQESDLLLIIDAPMKISPFLPSKLIDYIGANKPIFGITPPGTAQKLIEEMGFLVAHPHDLEGIARKLSKMIQDIKGRKLQAVPARIRNRYSLETVGRKMSNILKDLV